MTTELLDIHPLELKLAFELKKQSSCSVQLINRSDQFVAFKVMTTSPLKYCVGPNKGIIKPRAMCNFTVTMQSQNVAPPNMLCKDKFLVQSTVVTFGTTEEDITSEMFSRHSGKHIDEKKLKVILVTPHSPVLLPNDADLKKDLSCEALSPRDVPENGIENVPPVHESMEDVLGSKAAMNPDELRSAKDADLRPPDELKLALDKVESKFIQEVEELKSKLHSMDRKLREADHTINELKGETSMITEETNELKLELLHKDSSCFKAAAYRAGDVLRFKMEKDVDELRAIQDAASMPPGEMGEQESANATTDLRLVQELEELKSKLQEKELKLKEANHNTMKLTDEGSMATKEIDILKQNIEVLRRKNSVRRIKVGFPLLFVCLVGLISLALGYLIHP